MDGGPRGPRDDFFCWKFRVWYNLRDCVYRHGWQTCPDCADCAQGASNLKLLGRVPDPPRWSEVARAVGEPPFGRARRRAEGPASALDPDSEASEA